jgi:hypothetical protein
MVVFKRLDGSHLVLSPELHSK